MNRQDETELHRLCAALGKLDAQCGPSPETHEALSKAALALIHAFMAGRRKEIEQQYEHLGEALNVEQIAYLRSLGIEIEE